MVFCCVKGLSGGVLWQCCVVLGCVVGCVCVVVIDEVFGCVICVEIVYLFGEQVFFVFLLYGGFEEICVVFEEGFVYVWVVKQECVICFWKNVVWVDVVLDFVGYFFFFGLWLGNGVDVVVGEVFDFVVVVEDYVVVVCYVKVFVQYVVGEDVCGDEFFNGVVVFDDVVFDLCIGVFVQLDVQWCYVVFDVDMVDDDFFIVVIVVLVFNY